MTKFTLDEERKRIEEENARQIDPVTGLLRDGARLRFPLHMKDSGPPRRGAGTASDPIIINTNLRGTQFQDQHQNDSMKIEDARMATHAAIGRDAMGGDQFAGNRPGFRGTTDAVDFSAVEKAYNDGVAELCDAWRPKDAVALSGKWPLSAGAGNACTLNGQPGTLQPDGSGSLICVPTPGPTRADAVGTLDAVNAAYNQMVTDLNNAWKTPG